MFAFEDSEGEYEEEEEPTVKVDKTKDHALLSLLGKIKIFIFEKKILRNNLILTFSPLK